MAFTYTGEYVDIGFGRGWLNRPAANSLRRIDAQLGHAMQVTEAGRYRFQQQAHYDHYLRYGSPIALHPDTPSLHQVGNAIDSNEAQRIVAILEDHGWRRTVYRWVNGVWTLVEPWHFEYFEHLDNHRHEGSPAGAEEDDMTPDQDRALAAIYHNQGRIMQILEAMDVRTGNTQTGNLAIAAERIANLPAAVWSHPLKHTLIDGLEVPAGDLLRFEPAEHENTRRAVAAIATGDIDYDKVAAEIAAAFPQLDPHAFAVAAADEADRRDRERLGSGG